MWKNRASSAEQLMPQPDMELGCSMKSVDIQLKALKPYSILEHLFECSMCSRTHPFLVSDHPCCVFERTPCRSSTESFCNLGEGSSSGGVSFPKVCLSDKTDKLRLECAMVDLQGTWRLRSQKNQRPR